MMGLFSGLFGGKKSKAQNDNKEKVVAPLEEKTATPTEASKPVKRRMDLLTFRAVGISDEKVQRAIKQNIVEEYLEENEAYDGMSNKEILDDGGDVYQVDIDGDYEIELRPEPDNPYNNKAIRIEHKDIGKVGYVPDKNLKKVHEIIARNNFSLEWQLLGGKVKSVEYDEDKDKDVVKVKELNYGIEITLTEPAQE